jgi:hypothetical protein
MTMENQYKNALEALKANKNIGAKAELLSYKGKLNGIGITFNKYLTITADDNYIEINYNLHWHPNGINEMVEDLNKIANGELIFVDGMFFTLKMLEKKRFEKRRAKLLAKKRLRIYTGNEIIKEKGEKK